MSYVNTQDWTTVVFRKPKPVAQVTQPKSQQPNAKVNNQTHNSLIHSASSKPAWKIEKQVDDDTSKAPLNYVSTQDAKIIIQARVAAKLSQKELATRLNLQEREIKDIEACKAVENKALLARIKKFLNLRTMQ